MHSPTIRRAEHAPTGRADWLAAVVAVSVVLALVLSGGGLPGTRLLLAVVGVALLIATTKRPHIGYYTLLLGIPLTAGLARDATFLSARPSELLIGLVAVALFVRLHGHGGTFAFRGLDLAIGAFTLGVVLIPALVLILGNTAADAGTWRTILAPIEYLALYLMFSRAELPPGSLRMGLNLAFVASVIVAAVGLAQLAGVLGAREFVQAHYAGGPTYQAACDTDFCRPTSLLDHWSGFGAYAVLNYALALGLFIKRPPGFSGLWLAAVITANVLAAMASLTQAAAAGLLIATGAVLWHQRRAPRKLLGIAAAVALGLIPLWPALQLRINSQLTVSNQGPDSLETRIQYWNQFFIPALREHALVGTGNVIPSDIPLWLRGFVDNEYLALGLRAGIAGICLLLLMWGVIAATAWQARRNTSPEGAALGATALAYVLCLAIMGTTASYLTFAGVTQLFWMVVGLFAGCQSLRAAAAVPLWPRDPTAARPVLLAS